MLRAVILTQYRRVTDRRTDGQTDGIAVASTALAMRRAVKIKYLKHNHLMYKHTLHKAQQTCLTNINNISS